MLTVSYICVITVLSSEGCAQEVLGQASLLPLKSGFYASSHICLEPPASLSLLLAWLLSTQLPGSPYETHQLSPMPGTSCDRQVVG